MVSVTVPAWSILGAIILANYAGPLIATAAAALLIVPAQLQIPWRAEN